MTRLNYSQIRLLAGLWFVLWLAYTVLQSIHAVADFRKIGGEQIWKPVLWESSSIAVAGVLFFGVWWFTDRFPFSREHLVLRLFQHAGAAVAFSLLHVFGMNLIRFGVYGLLGAVYEPDQPLLEILIYEFSKDLPTYVSMVVIASMLITHFSYRRELLAKIHLEKELVQLQSRRLREQLRPHFLFNALNLVSSTMYEDVEKADGLLAKVSELLRHSLEAPDQVCIPLSRELYFLELYLAIIDARFDGKITHEVRVPEYLAGALIPRFLLQPLVENAVNHGFLHRGGRGHIQVSARLENESLCLEIEDDGLGLQTDRESARHQGIGLSNTLKTLQHLYGSQGRLQLNNRPAGGLCVTITMPFTTAEPEEVRHEIADHG